MEFVSVKDSILDHFLDRLGHHAGVFGLRLMDGGGGLGIGEVFALPDRRGEVLQHLLAVKCFRVLAAHGAV